MVTLPAKLRTAVGPEGRDQLIAETTPEGLLLRPAVTLPIELYRPRVSASSTLLKPSWPAVLDEKTSRPKRAAQVSPLNTAPSRPALAAVVGRGIPG